MNSRFELLARAVWDKSGNVDWMRGEEIPCFENAVIQHHTADEFIEPEPMDWPHDVVDPRPPHLGIIRIFRAKSPRWQDNVAARRRYNTHSGFAQGREEHGKITRWVEIEHRRTGEPVDEKGRHQYVSVRIDTERIAQLKAKQQAKIRIQLAKISRIKALERSAMVHMDNYHRRLGWRGIGYNLVQFSRRFYAGRAVVVDGDLIRAYRGAHTGAANWNSKLGIAWNGNFTSRRLPDIMRIATVVFLRYVRCRVYGAHYDVMATACPGRPRVELASIARDAGAKRLS